MSPRIFGRTAFVVALSLVPTLTYAAQHSRGGGGGGGSQSHAAAAPRSSSAPRSYATPRTYSMPRTYSAPRAYAASRPYAVPRTYASPGLYAAQRGVARMGGPVRVAPGRFTTRVIGPRVIVGAPFRGFYRPYYAFRPRFSIGFGLFVGYPVAFPYYAYAYPYPYPYPYSYPYPYRGALNTRNLAIFEFT